MASKSAEITLNMSWGNCKQVLSGIQGRIGSVMKTMSKLSGIGAMVGASFGAIGAALAVGKGIMDRVAEAEKYRLALGDLENAQKRLVMQDKTMGYQSAENRKAYLDLQIQIEKLNWENRFLTENDKKVEEGMKNLKVAIGATQGTMVDMAMSIASEWFPSMESVEKFLIDNIVPALTYVQTAWENASKIWTFIVTSLAKSILDIFGPVCYFLFDYFPARLQWFGENWTTIFQDTFHNLGALMDNLANNLGESIKWIVDGVLSLFPDSWQKTFQKIGVIMGNFCNNMKSYIQTLILEFFELPGKIATMGSNLLTIFSNLGSKIKDFFGNLTQLFTWENLKKAWRGELDIGATFAGLFKSDTNLLDGVSNYERKKDRVAQFGQSLIGPVTKRVDLTSGLSDIDKKNTGENAYGNYKPKWKNMTDGMVWNAMPFEQPFDAYEAGSKDLQKRLDKISLDIAGSYGKNKSQLELSMRKNFEKEKDKQGDKAVQPIGPAELLKMLEGSQKSSTEGLTAAYDRINSAVANKNPTVDVLRQQLEFSKKQADDQKALETKKAEKQAETASKTSESAASLDRIYNLLASWKTPQAAVVEG